MKTFRRTVLALALVFCLLAALGVSAHAENQSVELTASVGQPFSYSRTYLDVAVYRVSVQAESNVSAAAG